MGSEETLSIIRPRPYTETDLYPRREKTVDYPDIASDVTMMLVLFKKNTGSHADKVGRQIQKQFPGITEHLTALTDADSHADRTRGLLFLYGNRLPANSFSEVNEFWGQTLEVHKKNEENQRYQKKLAKVDIGDALQSLIEADGKRWSRRRMLRYTAAGITGVAAGSIFSALRSSAHAPQGAPALRETASPIPVSTKAEPISPPPTAEFTDSEMFAIENGKLHLRPTRLDFAGGSDKDGSYTLDGVTYGSETFGSPLPNADLSELDTWPERLTAQGLNVPALFQAVADEYGACVVVYPDSVHDGKASEFVDNLVLVDDTGNKIQVRQVTRLNESGIYLHRQDAGKTENRLIGEPLLFTSDRHSFVFIPRGERSGSNSSSLSGIAFKFAGLKTRREDLGINNLISWGPAGALLVTGAYGAISGDRDIGAIALLPVFASWNLLQDTTIEQAVEIMSRWGMHVKPEDFMETPGGIFAPSVLLKKYREIDDVLAQKGLYHIAGELDRLFGALQVTITAGSNYPDAMPYPVVTVPGATYPRNSKVTKEMLRRAGIDLP